MNKDLNLSWCQVNLILGIYLHSSSCKLNYKNTFSKLFLKKKTEVSFVTLISIHTIKIKLLIGGGGEGGESILTHHSKGWIINLQNRVIFLNLHKVCLNHKSQKCTYISFIQWKVLNILLLDNVCKGDYLEAYMVFRSRDLKNIVKRVA